MGKRPRGYKKHFPLSEDSTPSFLILLAYSHSSALRRNTCAAQMKALVSLGCIGTTLSLGPKTIYQMVIIESTKYWPWGQLESVANFSTPSVFHWP